MEPEIHSSQMFPAFTNMKCEVRPEGGEHLHYIAHRLSLGLMLVCSVHCNKTGEHSKSANRIGSTIK
jgi:hypothetical protein